MDDILLEQGMAVVLLYNNSVSERSKKVIVSSSGSELDTDELADWSRLVVSELTQHLKIDSIPFNSICSIYNIIYIEIKSGDSYFVTKRGDFEEGGFGYICW